jgi:hypothetical protein
MEEDIELVHRLTLYGKKLLGLSLIFNSLLSIVYAIGLLRGYYEDAWTLYPPFLVDGALFWVLIFASIINIAPATSIGQAKIGRLWFHHYVYGFLVLALAVIFLIALSPKSLFSLFTADTTDMMVNAGRFFVLGGLTLILDDLADISDVMRRLLCFLKLKFYRGRWIMEIVQYILGCLSIYLFAAVVLYIAQNPQNATPANVVLSATLLITSLVSFAAVKQKRWSEILDKKGETLIRDAVSS